MSLYKYTIEKSKIGEITIIWRDEGKFIIEEILLSLPNKSSKERAKEKYEREEELKIKKSKQLKKFLKELNKYFDGKPYKFSLDYLNLDKLSEFDREVLKAEFETPKGTVNTYKQLAERVNTPKAARPVGNALKKNPYPIIIPCHRTIKSDGNLGGYAGMKEGHKYKGILLELEGLEIKNRKISGKSRIISFDKTKQSKLM
ncbi:methylated-DNA--[protein]-cysteine S-methyltransferase [uncultured Methanobrevibacter sp.]|uniref:methylated-DNA--[protein]-cysteine S-methyltransferase n=1 Tax=uncultured Methanobrevibacter sp. TaxID=253161 RepID=UPI002626DF68